MTDAKRDKIESRVRGLVDGENGKLKGFELHVTGSREDGEWLHVIVAPSVPGVSVEKYVGILAAIEERVLDEEGVNVLLVPAVAVD